MVLNKDHKTIAEGTNDWKNNHPIYSMAIQMKKDGNLRGNSITLHQYPTLNCQVGSIASFNSVMDTFKETDKEEELLASLVEIDITLQKNLVLIDISRGRADRMRKFFNKYIHLDSPYTSTNGSMMVIMLLNFKDFRNNKYQL